MKVHFLTTAHNSLSQRLWVELTERGHKVSVTIASSGAAMVKSVEEQKPDLILGPMLTAKIPESIYAKHTCLIVHPGIMGDRGPSSLDWAIATGEKTWGVTVMEAVEDFDAGPIWAARTFPLGGAATAKSSLYRDQVTEAAVAAVLDAVAKFESRRFKPEPLDYSRADVRGRLRPLMRQHDRPIDWDVDPAETIIRKIRAADSAPGVLDTLYGRSYFLYGAHAEDRIKGAPGQILAQRDGAICRGTVDGAVWISHLKLRKDASLRSVAVPAGEAGENGETEQCVAADIKLPAVQVLGKLAAGVPESRISINEPATFRTFREITYWETDGAGFIGFEFYNGAMSTAQCDRLCDAFHFARRRPTKVIVLLGGRDFFSNGIHLNVIEAARDPAQESWRNINAINDLVNDILNTMSHLVISGIRGNAGAGGVMMALAADRVYGREGVVLNPHYKSMGGLYGSEYWTYTLPRRVGEEKARAVTEECRPIGTAEAKRIGLLDDCFGGNIDEFEAMLSSRALELAKADNFWRLLREKHEQRLRDERVKPLAAYRAQELNHMRQNFYGPDPAYHIARQKFVYKGRLPKGLERPAQDIGSAASPAV